MTDEFTDRCSVCKRLAYHSPLTDGICSHCTPNECDDLVKLMVATPDKFFYQFSQRDCRKAVIYLYNKLNGKLA